MYYCNECETIFKDPITVGEDVAPKDTSCLPGLYEYEICPNCGADDITEADRCPVCGDYHKPLEVANSDLCEGCARGIDLSLQGMAHGLSVYHKIGYETIKDAIIERASAWDEECA